MSASRVIKKYPNRRLYDTEISSYITIEDVRQLVTDGEAFEVRDARTGEDLTRCVLLQIIADQEQDGEAILPTQLLAQLIRFQDDAMQGLVGRYLEHAVQLFIEQQPRLRQQAEGAGQTPWTKLNQLTERNLDGWMDLQQNLGAGVGHHAGTARQGPKTRAG